MQALIGIVFAAAGSIEAVHAHHSPAGVDQTKITTVSGTLKDFDFSAPHSQIVVISDDGKGNPVETKVSAVSPAALTKQGFKPKDFPSGDKVEMTYHPNRTGVGGIMLTLKLGDGRVVNGGLY
jgi:hypothetical protein